MLTIHLKSSYFNSISCCSAHHFPIHSSQLNNYPWSKSMALVYQTSVSESYPLLLKESYLSNFLLRKFSLQIVSSQRRSYICQHLKNLKLTSFLKPWYCLRSQFSYHLDFQIMHLEKNQQTFCCLSCFLYSERHLLTKEEVEFNLNFSKMIIQALQCFQSMEDFTFTVSNSGHTHVS